MGIRLPEYPFPKDLKQVLDSDVGNIMSEKSQVYTKVLNAWKEAKRIDVTQTHYLQLLKIALYLEEYQCESDMKEYDLLNKSIFKTNTDIFHINANEWLDEEKPPIRAGDLIDIIDITDKRFYTLRIIDVNENSIAAVGAKFLESYSETKIYDIRFRYQNYPIRCNHYALWLADQRNIVNYLFPNNLKLPRNPTTYEIYATNITFFNPNIRGNFEQAQAMLNILKKSSFPYPYILYGPPGTGKTATIVESICQIVVRNPANNVLVCTPSNTAADEVTKRLLDYKPEFVFRMYSRSKDPLTIDEKIMPYCNCKNGKISFVNLELIVKKRIVITTLCSSMRLILMGLRSDHFSHVIIDEAGQSIEPDILIPISLVSGDKRLYSQIVLAGDPKQLGPTVMSKLAEIVLGRSILERFMSYPIYQKMSNGKYNSKYITKLLVNYRNHPDIIKISNRLFYNNELTTKSTAQQKEFPVTFYGVLGKEEKCKNSTSSLNFKEINMVVKFIEHIIKNKQDWELGTDFQEDIGVVTPFKLQSKEIKKELRRRNLSNINVGTVELFQGQEKKIIIISTVRTKTFSRGESMRIGFLSDPKRFNVAVTRAKSRLLIIGHPYALQTEPSWRHLLKYCISNKSYYGVYLKLSSSDDGARSHSLETSEIVRSSDILKWKKFKIFALDKMDSKTDVMETMHMILNSKMNTVRSIQPVTPVPPVRLPPFPEIDPIRPTSSVKLATPIEIAPIPKAKSVRPIQVIKPTSPIELMPSPKINPIHPTPPVKTTSPIQISSTSEVKSVRPVQPIKPTPPIELTPSPKISSIRLTPPVKPVAPIQLAPTPEVKPIQPIKIKPLPSIQSTPSPEISTIRPTPAPRPAFKPAAPIQLEPKREVQRNSSIMPKERKKKCCAIQ